MINYSRKIIYILITCVVTILFVCCSTRVINKKVSEEKKDTDTIDYKRSPIYNDIEEAKTNKEKVYQLALMWEDYTKLPVELCIFKELRVLALQHNRISTLESDCIYSELVELRELAVSDNNIDLIPEDLCNLKKLEYLNLAQNNITNLPDNFDQLSSLFAISLQSNKLTTFPNVLLKMKNIEYIWLDHNKIETIPKNIRNLEKLRTLSLSYNNISTIPTELYELKNLKEIALIGNPIDSTEIVKLKKKLVNCEVIW